MDRHMQYTEMTFVRSGTCHAKQKTSRPLGSIDPEAPGKNQAFLANFYTWHDGVARKFKLAHEYLQIKIAKLITIDKALFLLCFWTDKY